MKEREIPKKPEVPPLNEEQIRLLTELCFRHNSEEIPEVDLIFVFGTAISFGELAETLRKVLSKSKVLLLTGGVLEGLSESERIYQTVRGEIPKEMQVVLETQSSNTLENIEFGLKMVKPPKRLCFIVKSFHSGRAYLTLRRFLPDAELFQDSFDPYYNKRMDRESWHKDAELRARVFGEYLRIKKYGERKDLDFREVQDLLKSIDQTFS